MKRSTSTTISTLLREYNENPSAYNDSTLFNDFIAEAKAKDTAPKDGPEYVIWQRIVEIQLATPQHGAWLIQQHTTQAREFLERFSDNVTDTAFKTPLDRAKLYRALPEYLESRLAPCFANPQVNAIWDYDGSMQKRLYTLEKSYIAGLDEIDREYPSGPGKYKARVARYAAVYEDFRIDLMHLLTDMLFDFKWH
jgi:hypothetical protein